MHRALDTAPTPDRAEPDPTHRRSRPTTHAWEARPSAHHFSKRLHRARPTTAMARPDAPRVTPRGRPHRLRTRMWRNVELHDWHWWIRREDPRRSPDLVRDSPHLTPPTGFRPDVTARCRAPLDRPPGRLDTGRHAHLTDPSRRSSPTHVRRRRRRGGRRRAADRDPRRTG